MVETNPYNLGLSNLIAIYAMVVLGLNLFIGYTGQISLGTRSLLSPSAPTARPSAPPPWDGRPGR
jgi:antibiotic biosynthesis monooxygenase (ABM) superfamily enzyme